MTEPKTNRVGGSASSSPPRSPGRDLPSSQPFVWGDKGRTDNAGTSPTEAVGPVTLPGQCRRTDKSRALRDVSFLPWKYNQQGTPLAS
jgi:hypothetical protein